MEPNSREFYKQCAFQKFCNTVLHNEACDAHRELHRHKAREVTFSDLPLDEARQLLCGVKHLTPYYLVLQSHFQSLSALQYGYTLPLLHLYERVP